MVDTQTFTLTTAALPREGEVAGDGAKIASLNRVVATYRNREERILDDLRKRDELVEELQAEVHRKNCGIDRIDCMRAEAVARNAELVAELANRDEALALQAKEHDSAVANLIATANRLSGEKAERDRELAKRDDELAKAKVIDLALRTESQRRMGEIASLRTHLARAEAIEENAKAFAEVMDGWTLPDFERQFFLRLKDAFKPSPGSEPANPAERKCPHCGTHVGPDNLTCGTCARWIGEPATGPAGPSDVVVAAQALIDSVPDWKPGDELECALIDGGPIIALACALASLASPVIDASGSLDGNHTHGAFVRWAGRLAILERVAVASQAILRVSERANYTEAVERCLGPEIRWLRLVMTELDTLEATQ